MLIAPEEPTDADQIGEVITAAFRSHPFSAGTEAKIVEALRRNGALSVSLTARLGGKIVGHVAFSPVRITRQTGEWYGLGPLAVAPEHQRAGIGHALVARGLTQLRNAGAAGCVVLGDPKYYARFGFAADEALVYPGAPPGHFMRVAFHGERPSGTVTYDDAFSQA